MYFLLFFVVDSRQLAGPPPSRTRCAPDEEDESSLRNKSPNEGAKLEGKKKKVKVGSNIQKRKSITIEHAHIKQ